MAKARTKAATKEKKPKIDKVEAAKFELTPERKLRLMQRSYMRMIVDLALAFSERYGEEAWEIMRKTMYRIGQERGVKTKERMQIDPTDLRSIRMATAFSNSVFVGDDPKAVEVIESTPKRSVTRVYKCDQAEQLSRCSALCMAAFDYVDRGTFDELGVKFTRYEVPLMLSKGDPYCEVILEIE